MTGVRVAGGPRVRLRPVVATGLVATVAAAVATTAVAGVASALGVDLQVPDGGPVIPVAGFTTVTAGFCLVGVAIAAALARWSPRPATHFRRTTLTMTALSLVPPFVAGGNAPTVVTLVATHLVAAAVMIPALGRALRAQPYEQVDRRAED